MCSTTIVSSSPKRVSLIEDDAEVRDGLAAMITGSEGLTLAGSWDRAEAALRAIEGTRSDVVLVDLELPGISGIEAIRQMRLRWPSLCLLVLTVHEENDRIMRALCAGADGYLLKSLESTRLIGAIYEALQGGAPMSPEIARKVVTLFREAAPQPRSDYDLTPHERRILNMLVEGENYKTTAAKLGVSVNTVSYHVRHIYDKLHVHSRSEAVAKALRSGLLR